MTAPERMVKCTILASKAQLSTTITTLYDLGLYHITPHSAGELEIGDPLAEAEELSEAIVKIRSIRAAYPTVKKKPLNGLSKKSLSKAMEGVNKMYDTFLEVQESKTSARKTELHKKQDAYQFLTSKKINVTSLAKSTRLGYRFGTVKTIPIFENDDIATEQKGEYIFVLFTLPHEEYVDTILHQNAFESINLEMSEKEIATELAKIEKEEKITNGKEEKIMKDLPTIAGLEERFQEEIRKQELPLQFAVTKSSFVAKGWIPKADAEKVQQALTNETKNNIHVEIEEPGKKDDPPIKLKNKKLVTPFEFLLRLYDLPKYSEIDPTSIFFITFPLFFGYMLGDIGYGLVLMGVFYLLKKKLGHIPEVVQLSSILMFAAGMSILFGILYGEIFGFEHVSVATGQAWCDSIGLCLPEHTLESHGVTKVVADFPRVLMRTHDHINVLGYEVLSVLVIGAIVGFFHLNFGFIIGFLNELKSHGFAHAFMAKLSWIVLEFGLIGIVLGVLGIVPALMWIGVVVAVLGVGLLWKGEGIQGVVEIPALFSNTLSYMRLGAVGLASVGLAVVVNEKLALPFFDKGGVFIFVGILIMLLGHGINILLGVIGPFLHGVRLHYVELFSKFFHGGGEEYKPFKHTEDIQNGS